jgi:peptide/nickel transport system permease protein
MTTGIDAPAPGEFTENTPGGALTGGTLIIEEPAVWQPNLEDELQKHASPGQLAWGRFRRNRLAIVGLTTIIVLTVLAILAPIVAPHDPIRPDVKAFGKPPSATHILGTDLSGRDVLSRLIYGARVSLSVGLVAVGIYLTIGTILGALAGYRRGTTDAVIMRITDTVMSFPALIIILAVVPILGPSIFNIMLVIGLLGWPPVARLVRGEFLSLREREFALAARGIGASDRRIIYRHILPNVAGPLVVVASFGMADAIITEAGLSFLGLGVQPPEPSWGQMLNSAIDVGTIVEKPWVWLAPAAAIAITVLAINFVGDGLRDALDPRGSVNRR